MPSSRTSLVKPRQRTRRSAGRRVTGEIPPRGWLAVLRRVTSEAISDEVGIAAASCGFYALFALFPAISVAISLYGLVADPWR